MDIIRISGNSTRSIVSFLGMARKAHDVAIGLDRIRFELVKKKHLLILLANDYSLNVLRSLAGYQDRGQCKIIILEDCDRNCLSQSLGVNNTQVVAVERSSGFHKKLLQLASEGGDAFE